MKELCELVRRNRNTILRWINNRGFPSGEDPTGSGIGKKLYPKKTVDAWLRLNGLTIE
jgi:hypothetical protein